MTKKYCLTIINLFVGAALLLAGCGGPPPQNLSHTTEKPVQQTPQATPSATQDITTTTQLVATPQPAAAEPAPTAYDPALDPIVNPAQLFEQAPEQADAIASDETLVRYMSGNPNSLNPVFTSSVQDGQAQGLLYNSLFTFDKNMIWGVNEDIVESYEESEDHLVWTVKMKPGLTWQDDQPWTAHDVAFSFEAIMNDAVPAIAVRAGTDELASVQALDDLTVKFVHKEALATSKWNMLFPIIPKHIYDLDEERTTDPTLKNSEYYKHANFDGVVGNGAYKLAEWVENDRIAFERWDGYAGDKPYFKRVVFKINPDPNTSLLLFSKGELDDIGLNPKQFALETVDSEFQELAWKAYGPSWGFGYIGWNMDGSNPFFSDRRVRYAMTHALDIQRIIKDIMYNLREQCHGIYHPDSWMYNPDVQVLGYDLKKSAALLDEAGWLISDEDGWRYKEIDGVPVKFEFELLIPQGADSSVQIAAIYQRDLKKVGVSLKTRVLEWAAFQELVQNHEHQAQIAGWGTGTDPDTGWNLWHSSEYESGRNYCGYNNPRVDELFELGRREFDPEKRAAIYQEIHKLIYDDQPYTFLTNGAISWAFQKRIRGVIFSPRGVDGFDPGMSAWWVPKGESLRVY